jgi:hypothetical protein
MSDRHRLAVAVFLALNDLELLGATADSRSCSKFSLIGLCSPVSNDLGIFIGLNTQSHIFLLLVHLSLLRSRTLTLEEVIRSRNSFSLQHTLVCPCVYWFWRSDTADRSLANGRHWRDCFVITCIPLLIGSDSPNRHASAQTLLRRCAVFLKTDDDFDGFLVFDDFWVAFGKVTSVLIERPGVW